MAFSIAQQKALAILPKISGFCSMIASTLIVWIVAKDENKRSSTYHRLIGGSSLIDIISSFASGLSTWPMPRYSGRIWAVGTTQTCTAQGFLSTLSLGSAMYSASLTLYYQLTIVHGWRDDRIYKIEPYFHAIPLLWTLANAIANVPLDNYNPALSWCGTQEYPIGCSESASMDCIRGEHARPFMWLFYASLWFSILVISVNVTCVFFHVFRIEKRSEAYRFRAKHGGSHDNNNNGTNGNVSDVDTSRQRRQNDRFKRTRQVAYRCFLYAGAFYFTWVPYTVRPRRCLLVLVALMIFSLTMPIFLGRQQIARSIQADAGKSPRFPITVIAVTTSPLQGLPTFIIYLGPKFRRHMRENPNAGVLAWCKHAFRSDSAISTQVSSGTNGQSVNSEGEPT